mmetsp:Transcript_24526/g.33615  ORF Transcript_24526/g.33615 Transcript_24526/m.33615 type:complete len:325 (-) Transcript_24526:352-1326(-)
MDEEKLQKANKKPWTNEEDEKLSSLYNMKGATWKWSKIAEKLDMGRTGKQCRERYNNHLRPEIKKGNWTKEEDKIILELKMLYGNQWTRIASFLPGRSDNSIKNRWHLIDRSKKSGNQTNLYPKCNYLPVTDSTSQSQTKSASSPFQNMENRNRVHFSEQLTDMSVVTQPIKTASSIGQLKRCHSLLDDSVIKPSGGSLSLLGFDDIIETQQDWHVSTTNTPSTQTNSFEDSGNISPTTTEDTWIDEFLEDEKVQTFFWKQFASTQMFNNVSRPQPVDSSIQNNIDCSSDFYPVSVADIRPGLFQLLNSNSTNKPNKRIKFNNI